MTREEAIKLVDSALHQGKSVTPADTIKLFVELGMLKLEEPKSADENFEQLMRNVKITQPQIEVLLHGMRMSGLKIVEK
jgi:hypothetical protein